MKHKTLVTVLALLLIIGAGTVLAQSADAGTPTAAPVPGTIIPAPLQLAAGSIDGGVTALSGCTAEQDCPDGPAISCTATGTGSCYVLPYSVECNGNYTNCTCFHPECSNPECECHCYEQYSYGSGFVRCLTNCSLGC